MITEIFKPISDVVNNVIDRVIPDPEKAQQAKLEYAKMEMTGELEQAKTQLSAIIAEAQSEDPFTSRARPSFLYVMYIMVLAAIPMGLLHAINPGLANSIADGMKSWLAAIPEPLWVLFGTGYLGYAFSRGYEKGKLFKGKMK